MSKILGISVAFAIALGPTLAVSAPAEKSRNNPVVTGTDGSVIGRDPTLSIRQNLKRDHDNFNAW